MGVLFSVSRVDVITEDNGVVGLRTVDVRQDAATARHLHRAVVYEQVVDQQLHARNLSFSYSIFKSAVTNIIPQSL